MIRPATPGDVPAILDLVIAAGLFSAEEADLVAGLYDAYFDGADGHGSLVAEAGGLAGVVYYKPCDAADRVWDLTMLAVRPDAQRGGRGAALMTHVERTLRAAGQRLLLVETSSTAPYDAARAFYARCGYDEEARIRGYWADGDDMVLFRKAL